MNISASNFTSTTPGTTFNWINSDASIGLAASGTGNTPSFTATNNTVLLVTAIVSVTPTASGCPGTPASFNITVNPNPVLVITPSSASFCNGGSTNLIVSGADNYSWSPAIGLSNTNGDTVTASPEVTTTYIVTGNYYGCIKDTSVTITVYPNPVIVFEASDTAGCKPLCVDFLNESSIASGNIISWLWNFGDGEESTESNPFHCYPDTGNYTVSLVGVSDHQCLTQLIFENYISVFPLPEAEFSFTPDSATIIDPTFYFTDESLGATEWYWDFGDGETTSNLIPHPVHTFPTEEAGTYEVRLLAVNQYGCTDSISHEVITTPIVTLYIPNAFSPNDDHRNNIFYAYGLGIVEFEMMIFDRWGEHLFTSEDLLYGWDGRYRGNIVQEDVYVYRVTYTGIDHSSGVRVGIVTVVK